MSRFTHIDEQLKRIEDKYNVEILYAVESGSRAWGFANAESDHDVRFVYRYPTRRYLELGTPRPVIDETVGKYDITGWDVKKAFMLHRKSNVTLHEWINSPVVFRPNDTLFMGLPAMDRSRMMLHYRGLVFSEWRNAGQTFETLKRVKRYLYCMRCALAFNVLFNGGNSVPVDIGRLADGLDDADVKNGLYGLIDFYRGKDVEIDTSVIDYIGNWVGWAEKLSFVPEPEPDIGVYNDKLVEILYDG